jgi:hypothetical protein
MTKQGGVKMTSKNPLLKPNFDSEELEEEEREYVVEKIWEFFGDR